MLGALNIAPEDRDVHDPAAWEGKVLVSEPERQAFHDLLRQGLQDCFRLFDQGERQYSWWDYRAGGSDAITVCASTTSWPVPPWLPTV